MKLDMHVPSPATVMYRVASGEVSDRSFEQMLSAQVRVNTEHRFGGDPSHAFRGQRTTSQKLPELDEQVLNHVKVENVRESSVSLHQSEQLSSSNTQEDPLAITCTAPWVLQAVADVQLDRDTVEVVVLGSRDDEKIQFLWGEETGLRHFAVDNNSSNSPLSANTLPDDFKQLLKTEDCSEVVPVTTQSELICLTKVSADQANPKTRTWREKDRLEFPVAGMNSIETTYRLSPHAVLPASPVVVAEQVKHWLVRDVQHAQLSLQGLGEEPVQVAISVQGQLAQVAFTTDHVQTRQLLETSLHELSSMLSRDGLVLSGASVGTSSHRQPQSQSGSAGWVAARTIRSSVPAVEVVSGDSLTRASGGNSLDLYV